VVQASQPAGWVVSVVWSACMLSEELVGEFDASGEDCEEEEFGLGMESSSRSGMSWIPTAKSGRRRTSDSEGSVMLRAKETGSDEKIDRI